MLTKWASGRSEAARRDVQNAWQAAKWEASSIAAAADKKGEIAVFLAKKRQKKKLATNVPQNTHWKLLLQNLYI